MLSGGLDSSSLTCLAARQPANAPVRAVSIRFGDQPELDEGPYIDAVRACGNIHGIDIPAHPDPGLGGLEAFFAEQGYPIYAPNQSMMRQNYAAAAQTGASVLIDGHGGDEVIGMGYWYFSELAYEKRWRTLWRTLKAHRAAADLDYSVTTEMVRALRVHGPRGMRKVLNWTARDTKSAANSPSLLLPDASRSLAEAREAVSQGPDPFAHDHLPPYQRLHAQILFNADTATAFEAFDRLGAHMGITPRFPFYDRHVVEITLGQDTRNKFGPGQPRLLLRRAMKGVLPEAVRLRPGKTNFMPKVISGFQAPQRARLAELSQRLPDDLAAYVDPNSLRDLIRAFDEPARRAEAIGPLLRLLWLDLWLAIRTTSAAARTYR